MSYSDFIVRNRGGINLSLFGFGCDIYCGFPAATMANIAAIFTSRVLLPAALNTAVKWRFSNVVSILLKMSVDPNAAFATACEQEDLPLVRELIERGADVDQIGQYGLTQLHIAAGRGNINLASMLKMAGADPFKGAAIRSKINGTPFWLAKDDRNMLLLFLGADKMEQFKFCQTLNHIMDNLFPPKWDIADVPIPIHLIPGIDSVHPFLENTTVSFDEELKRVAFSNPTLENILALLKSHNLFKQTWKLANQDQELKIHFVPKEKVSPFNDTRGCYRFEDHEIFVDESLSAKKKIWTVIFETMHSIQRSTCEKESKLAKSGELDRETYALLSERIEYNSFLWAKRIMNSLDLKETQPDHSFVEHWKLLHDNFDENEMVHADKTRRQWDHHFASYFFAKHPEILEKRKQEMQKERDEWSAKMKQILGL